MTSQEARDLINTIYRDKALHGDDGETLTVRRIKTYRATDKSTFLTTWIDCDDCEEGICPDDEPERFVREFIEDHLGCRHTPEMTAF